MLNKWTIQLISWIKKQDIINWSPTSTLYTVFGTNVQFHTIFICLCIQTNVLEHNNFKLYLKTILPFGQSSYNPYFLFINSLIMFVLLCYNGGFVEKYYTKFFAISCICHINGCKSPDCSFLIYGCLTKGDLSVIKPSAPTPQTKTSLIYSLHRMSWAVPFKSTALPRANWQRHSWNRETE